MVASTSLLVDVLTALFVLVLTLITSALAWYVRRYIIQEVRRNTALRRFLLGSDVDRDDGMLAEMQELRNEVREEHEEVTEGLDYVAEYCHNIAEAVNADVDEPDIHRDDSWRSSEDD